MVAHGVDVQLAGWTTSIPAIEEAETYVAEEREGTEADGPFWLLHNITVIATKR
jgi:hypothetical protein